MRTQGISTTRNPGITRASTKPGAIQGSSGGLESGMLANRTHTRAKPTAPLSVIGALTVASFPWESSASTLGRSPSYYMSLLLVVAVALSVVSRNDSERLPLPQGIIASSAAFIVMAFISIGYSIAPGTSAQNAALLFFLCATSLSLAYACHRSLEFTLYSYFVSCVLVAFVGILGIRQTSVTSPDGRDVRETAFGNYNDTSFYLAIGVIIGLFLFIQGDPSRMRRWWLVAGTAPLLAAIIGSGSRGSLLACAIGSTMCLLAFAARGRAGTATCVALVGLVSAASLPYVTGTSLNAGSLRSLRLLDSQGGFATAGRDYIWELALSTAPPFYGYGYGTSQQVMAGLVGRPQAVHNGYISTWIDLGWLGVLLSALALTQLAFWSTRSSTRTPLFVGLWTAAAIGAFIYPLELRRNLWIVIALALAQASLNYQERRESDVRMPQRRSAGSTYWMDSRTRTVSPQWQHMKTGPSPRIDSWTRSPYRGPSDTGGESEAASHNRLGRSAQARRVIT